MFKQKSLAAAIIGGVFLALCPQNSWAEGYTSAEFLSESAEGQKNFIEISVMMAGAIATQASPDLAGCMDRWYFGNEAARPQRVAHIISVMRQYPGYHPSGVILAVLQKVCGTFK